MIPRSPISIEEFMRRALAGGASGYYTRRISGIGNRGDFTTAPMISDDLARAVAKWAARAMRSARCWSLIELGPGEGVLMKSVLRLLPWHLRLRADVRLVETSAPLREIQQRNLGGRVSWHAHPAEALDACGGAAVIFSNELVDAFPARVFQRSESGWQEVGVFREEVGTIRETLLATAETLPESTALHRDFPPGQRTEIHDSYRQWLSEWVPHWKSGRMLTIDYGAEIDSLYHRRPQGTLRGYLLQQRLEGMAVYQNPGRQDLTCDVNFSDLRQWSDQLGLRSKITDFAEFLKRGGCGNSPLADPNGAGAAFQVLETWR